MRYEGSVIRPPSEADSLIVQVTLGCSHGDCSFCGTYLQKPFRVRPFAEVADDIQNLPEWARQQYRRAFLADGDALVLPTRRLLEIIALLYREMPFLDRVSCYANAQNLLKKEPEDLERLREAGLELLYLGLESGDDETLHDCAKGVTVDEQVEGCLKAKQAGMELSVTTILGLAGEKRSLEHARATGRALSRIDPEYIGVLSLMVVDGTPLAERMLRGEFTVPNPWAMLRELRELIAATDVTDSLFRSNHASNYLPVGGRLPQDKPRMLAALDRVLDHPDAANLRPESWRAL
jgi:radical SAM superfamily enzyme YgiQ (UPF0313 family)